MHRLPVTPQPLAVGQSMILPHGAGKLTFTGYRQWISLAITYDPGQLPALISALAALAGLILSFMIRRRRVFVRARRRSRRAGRCARRRRPDPDGRGGRLRGGVRRAGQGSARHPPRQPAQHGQRGSASTVQPARWSRSVPSSPPVQTAAVTTSLLGSTPRGSEVPVPATINSGLADASNGLAAVHGHPVRARHAGYACDFAFRKERLRRPGAAPGARTGRACGAAAASAARCR